MQQLLVSNCHAFLAVPDVRVELVLVADSPLGINLRIPGCTGGSVPVLEGDDN